MYEIFLTIEQKSVLGNVFLISEVQTNFEICDEINQFAG
jgi:hypothetical protein